MRISVVIPSFNKAPYIRDAIRSVIEQDYSETEIIVVDDGSTDESRSIIRSFDSKVQAIYQENRGACHARNRGARAATGQALMFLDADDLINSKTLTALASALRPKKKSVVMGPWKFLEWEGDCWHPKPPEQPARPPRGDYILGWLTEWFTPPCGILWSRKAFEAAGGWDESVHANQDGDLILRALTTSGVNVSRTSRGMSLYRDFSNTPKENSLKTKTTPEAVLSRARVEQRLARRLQEKNLLEPYAAAIGRNLHRLAKRGFALRGQSDGFYERLGEIARTARKIGGRRSIHGSFMHQLACHTIGLSRKEKLASILAQIGLGRRKRVSSH
jgi:glycosyltransferase involved in cell wall biosynthesis